MMLGLLGDILGLVVSVSSSQNAADWSPEKNHNAIGLNVSIGIGRPDTAEGAKYENRHRFEGTEPSMDIAETEDTVRIIINFPGIREEDAQFIAKSGALEVVISKNGHVFRKEIQCDVKESASIKSSILNNSVLDVTLSKN